MTKPLVIFPDPLVVALRALRGPFALTLPAGASISRTLPKRDAATSAPAVVVADDGDAGSGSWPVSEDALLRVSVWDNDFARAGQIARTARAHLLAYPGDGASRGFTRGTRPLTGTDPDDGTPVATFTIIARLKAE